MVWILLVLMTAAVRSRLASRVRPRGVQRAGGLQDVHAQQQVGLAVGDHGRQGLLRGVVQNLADRAAVADGQALLVQEDDVVAFLVPGADDDAGGHADAQSAVAQQAASPRTFQRAFDGLGDVLQVQLRQAGPRGALALDGDPLEAVARPHALARAVVDARGDVGVHPQAVVALHVAQARAAGHLDARQAEATDLRVDVHVLRRGEEAFVPGDLAVLAALAAHAGDAAFLVRDDHLHARRQERVFQQAAVFLAQLRIGPDDRHLVGPGHAADDFLDVLGGREVAQDVVVHAGRGLVAGHGRGAVVQDDEGDVLSELDGL